MCGDIPLSAQGGAEVSELCVCVGRGGGLVSVCVFIHVCMLGEASVGPSVWGYTCLRRC